MGSLIFARQNFNFIGFIIFLIFLTVLAVVVFILYKKIDEYHKSPEYVEKIRNQPSSKKDIKQFCTIHSIPLEYRNLVYDIFTQDGIGNIFNCEINNNFLFSTFHDYYNILIKQNATEEQLNSFFQLNYFMETICSQGKKLSSTKYIPVSSIIFLISNDGEQFPFPVCKITQDNFTLNIPDFFYRSDKRPQLLKRIRFVYTTKDGISYSFITRAIRYEESENKTYNMIIAHTENMESQVQRHYRRLVVNDSCFFATLSIKIIENSNKKPIYNVGEKKYEGKLVNISGGGCCISTNLPIKENQLIALFFPSLNISDRIAGVIKKTRRTDDGNFALHIQFTDFSLESQNKILSYVYKYTI